MPLFDDYLMVDWSAASRPARGRDSIWLGLTMRRRTGPFLAGLENPATRSAATGRIIELAAASLARGRRILMGFDFPFGFPVGTAERLGLPGLPWRHMWQLLADGLRDEDDNANNRFDLAERLNERLTGEAFPFWGLAREEERRFLRRRGRRPDRGISTNGASATPACRRHSRCGNCPGPGRSAARALPASRGCGRSGGTRGSR